MALVGCGDNLAPSASFELVGHADLGARGMNAALAIAGDTAYVGSRIDGAGIAILDIADPEHPAVVGEIGAPEGLAGMSSRELRAVPDKDLLVVMNLACSPDLHGCKSTQGEGENLRFYSIADRRAPQLLSTYPIHGTFRLPRSPHEMFLVRTGDRVLLYVSIPPGVPSLEVIDITDPTAPLSIAHFDPIADGKLPNANGNDILHSVSASPDGRVAYLSHQTGGLVLADLGQVIDRAAAPVISLITPAANAFHWPGEQMGPHGAVKVPGRELLVVGEEVYPMPYGAGCPFGHLHVVDIADPANPTQVGELALAENTCDGAHAHSTFTAHNATVTHDLALVTWYAAGLVAVDLADAAHPKLLAQFVPEPLPHVTVEDPGLGGDPVEMWSYPIIANGLVYAVDVRNGLYILRYRGWHGEQVSGLAFAEGNSNLP